MAGAVLAVLGAIVLLIVRSSSVQQDESVEQAPAPINRAPEIQTLELVLTPSDVVARAQGHDIDGDRFRYRYRWTVAGRPQRARGALLSRSLVAPGENVEVETTPVDSHGASGRPMRSSLTVDSATP